MPKPFLSASLGAIAVWSLISLATAASPQSTEPSSFAKQRVPLEPVDRGSPIGTFGPGTRYDEPVDTNTGGTATEGASPADSPADSPNGDLMQEILPPSLEPQHRGDPSTELPAADPIPEEERSPIDLLPDDFLNPENNQQGNEPNHEPSHGQSHPSPDTPAVPSDPLDPSTPASSVELVPPEPNSPAPNSPEPNPTESAPQ